MLRIAFLASHGGSSMQAIVEASKQGELDVEPVLTISNNGNAKALIVASELGLKTFHLSSKTEGSEETLDERILSLFQENKIDIVVLSGYMRKLGPKTLNFFRNRILNIHPALLPNFGGTGMYGIRVHEAVIKARASESGATVHLVDELYDHGRILGQARVPVFRTDTPETLQKRILPVELELYVSVLKDIVSGAVVLDVP